MNERIVPASVVFKLFLAGWGSQLSWALLCLGMVLFWVFFMNADLSFMHFGGQVERVEGVVTGSEETNVTVNDEEVIANSYYFMSRDSIEFWDVSYAAGRWYPEGKKVVVEYPLAKPHLSRIQGMRREIFGPGTAFVAVVPLAALIAVLFSLKKGIRARRLLGRGKLAAGRLVDREATNTEVNGQTVYKLTFAFVADDGREYKVVHKTHETESLEDEEEERLLYDELDPQMALMVDTLPGRPELDKNGNIRPGSAAPLLFALPLLTLVGHGWYALSLLF